MDELLLAGGMLLGGALLGYSIRAVIFIVRKNGIEFAISKRIMDARETAQAIIDEANDRATLIDARGLELDARAGMLEQKAEDLLVRERELDDIADRQREILESIAGMSIEDARDALFVEAQELYEHDLTARSRSLDHKLHEQLTDRAKDILISAIQRLAVPTTNELTTSHVTLESDELKGKIVGKEGRNIRAFERLAGVELLIDETPGAIVVSCFDPVRRAIAVRALEELIRDGRIQPARIEEEIEKARTHIHEIIKQKGADAVYECGIYNLDPRLVAILGRLHFRTSYGQNVLAHSIEMAHLAEMLASEIGADPYIAKAGALVHDIGKALDHEFEGTHIDIGIKVMERFGTDPRIIAAMKSHHDDCPHETLEAVIVQTADMISGARPGARRDSAEAYIKRLGELESIASRFDGVEKVYALQAGREIRIFVHPEHISDLAARALARDIALSIEQELRYPGQIKVTIIRETRITDYAR
jgi:ribonuclease Y